MLLCNACHNSYGTSISNGNGSDAEEILFLRSHSKAEIVDMLRKHTYNDELNQSRRGSVKYYAGGGGGLCKPPSELELEKETLFDKAMTPRDVGKLNRLVIPKQQAEKHFPLEISGGGAVNRVLLNFEDSGGKAWRFRYSYWNSSQRYVLAKGWSRFVKEKRLKAGDVVSFLRSAGPDGKLYIDWKPRVAVQHRRVGGDGGDSGGGGWFYSSLVPLPFQVNAGEKVVRLEREEEGSGAITTP